MHMYAGVHSYEGSGFRQVGAKFRIKAPQKL